MSQGPTRKATRPMLHLILILILILIKLESCRAFYASCPPGWMQWRQSCYIRLPDKMNWFQASEACNRPGSFLAVPDSKDENDFIWQSMVKKVDGLWIGCTDAAQEGIWLCGGQPARYTNWNQQRFKNNDHYNCARLTTHSSPGAEWSDNDHCGIRKRVACKMTASLVPVYHTFTGPDGRVPQQCLLHHDIKNLTVEGVLACGWACWADPRCRSFNLWQNSKREKMCQLNDVTRLGADAVDFKTIDNCYFFDLCKSQ